ncbi:hypothetical protein [Belliella pelovolcani]|uniref:hypothetical protein n=1 Tax=Belliella pelovolcani TaxID=529505 RepID=UPI00391AB680
MSQQVITDIEAIRKYIEVADKKLINQMLNGLDIAKDLPVLRDVREPRHLKKMVVDAGARRLNTSIKKAKGGRTFSERILTPQGAMKIIEIIPEEVRESFMSSQLDPNAKEIPFGQWVWQQEFAKIASEINDNFFYSVNPETIPAFSATATYAEGALVYFNDIVYEMIDDVDTTAGQSPETHQAKWADVDNKVICDGPDKIIEEELTAGNLLISGSGGSFDKDSAYDAVMDLWDPIPEAHKNKRLVLLTSYDVQSDIAISQNKQFGTGVGVGSVDIEQGKPFVVKGTGGRLTVVPNTWMLGSRRLMATMAGNAVIGMNQTGDASKVGKVIENLHGYEAIVKWMIGFQFRDLEVLYVNDQR